MIFVLAIVVLACKKKARYDFSFTPNGDIYDGDTVFFESTAPEGSAYLWRFGDEGTSEAPKPYHVFSVSGDVTVMLEVNKEPSTTVVHTITISPAGAKYKSMLNGTFTWRHFYTDAKPWPPYHTTYPQPDATISIQFLDPASVLIAGDTLKYNASSSTDSLVVFYKSEFFVSYPYTKSLSLNHYTRSMTYHTTKHISAGAGEESHSYYTP